MELLQHLDRLNYHEAWIGEHHSGGFEIIASPEMFIAAAAERTRHIRLGTGVASLPYHNPFMLADRMVQLDHMTRGRAMFGVGPGALVHDALKIGIKAADQRRMMNESLDVIMRLLRGEIVTEKTDWFNLVDAQLQLPCYTQPIMEMAVAASRSPSGALASGRHGIGMLSIGGTSPEAMAKHIAELEPLRGAGAAQRPCGRPQQVAAGDADPRRRDAREGAGERAVRDRRVPRLFLATWATFPIVPPDIKDPYAFFVETGAGCIGTPDDAIAYIENLLNGVRRLRRDHGAGAQLGGLGCDEAALRADGALRAPAFPALARAAPRVATPMRAITTRTSPASRPPRCRRRSTAWQRARRRSSSHAGYHTTPLGRRDAGGLERRRDARAVLGLSRRRPAKDRAGAGVRRTGVELPVPGKRDCRARRLAHDRRRTHAGGGCARYRRIGRRVREPLRASRRADLPGQCRQRRQGLSVRLSRVAL